MRLFRYRPFNPEFLKSELSSDQVYLWHLDDQNDPFEGRFQYQYDISVDSILRQLKAQRDRLRSYDDTKKDKSWLHGDRASQVKEITTILRAATDEKLRELAESVFASKNYENPRLRQEIQAKHLAMTHRAVIACFSANTDSPTMFAHYASNHSGICIEYEVSTELVKPVEYTESVPVIDFLSPDDDVLMTARLLTKHLEWAYEQEHRLVIYDHPAGLYRDPHISVVGVIAGCKMKAEDMKTLRKLPGLMKRMKIDFWQAVPHASKYAFVRKPLDA